MNGKDYLETVRFKTLEVLEQKYYAYDIIAAFEAGQKYGQNLVKESDSLHCKRPICDHHKPKSKELSYVAWHDWADNKMRHGASQRQCKDCGRWFFKEEMNEGGC